MVDRHNRHLLIHHHHHLCHLRSVVLLCRSRLEQGRLWSSRKVSAQGERERGLRRRRGSTLVVQVVATSRAGVGRVICRAGRVVRVARSAVVWYVSHCGALPISSGSVEAFQCWCHCLQILRVRQQKWGSCDYHYAGRGARKNGTIQNLTPTNHLGSVGEWSGLHEFPMLSTTRADLNQTP